MRSSLELKNDGNMFADYCKVLVSNCSEMALHEKAYFPSPGISREDQKHETNIIFLSNVWLRKRSLGINKEHKKSLFFLSRALTRHSFTFDLRFLYELKQKVRLSETVYEIF